MDIKKFSSESTFEANVVTEIVSVIENGSAKNCSIGLSGGKTPRPIYQALANNAIFDFEKVEWYMVDERCVPRDNQDSNYKMITEAFGKAEPNFFKHFHYFDTALEPATAAEVYAKELNKIPSQQFDLIILGIGADGHTASLFPHSPALLETERLAVRTINEKAPNPPVRDRLTITWPMILASKQILLLASGVDKKDTIEALFNSNLDTTQFPAKRLLEHTNATLFWLE